MVNTQIWHRLFAAVLFTIIVLCLWCGEAQARREHIVYFRDTPNELNIYKIYGRKSGPTMMIVGGIQGDEPGGFLSADLYIDLSLRRGNLIVVPRANFNSILQFQRGSNGDMNRKFGTRESGDPESDIVRILEGLMAESDLLLNLHDGWGFYRPQFVSKMENPMRYGQSIIADAAEYTSPTTGRKLQLQAIAEQAISMINKEIDDSKYHFHFMNTKTGQKDSPYAEQRKSATFYALTQHGIPAFGVETSKNLPDIEMKVHQHNLAINAFMKIFGLEPEQPAIYLEEPKLDYMVISINNRVPVAVPDGQALYIHENDQIEVVHVEANYERGLSVDILGMGTINDFRRRFKVSSPTFIVAQKDHIRFGRIPVVFSDGSEPKPIEPGPVEPRPIEPGPVEPPQPVQPKPYRVKSFILEVNGKEYKVPDGGRMEAVEGDKVKVTAIETEGELIGNNPVVNFKGFVANQRNNTGEDRGHLIDSRNDLLKRYSLSRKEKLYEILVEQGKKRLARMTIRFSEPKLDYLVLTHNGGPEMRVKNGDTISIKAGDRVKVLDMKTNVPGNQGVELIVKGRVRQIKDSKVLLDFEAEKNRFLTLLLTRQGETFGKIVLRTS